VRARAALLASLLAAIAGCARACAPGATVDLPLDAAPPPSRPSIATVTLAKTDTRTWGLAADATHLYFSDVFGVVRRVPKNGGDVERLDASSFPPFGAAYDPKRAYANGYQSAAIEGATTATIDGARYSIDANGVFRDEAPGKRTTIARSFESGIARKTLVVDDERVYWVEPAAGAVFSAPKRGGAAYVVCDADSIHVDIAIVGDRLYVLGIDGSLASAPKSGGAVTYHGSLSSDLGSNRNAVWTMSEGSSLFIVSDATGYSVGNDIRFDGRVVRVALPPPSGEPLASKTNGLLFATNAWIENDEPQKSALARIAERLSPLRDALKDGRTPVTIAIGAGRNARAESLAAWMRDRLGAGVRFETVESADDGAREPTPVVGIHPRHIAGLLAPP
jgi:hypothetical protein